MKTFKTKLKLNNKQKTRLFRNASVARFAYNLTLEIQETNYKNGGKFLSDCEVRKIITKRKQEDLAWLFDFDCNIVKQAVKDACKAYKKFFDNKAKKPRFHSKKFTKPSFYVDGWQLKVEDGYIKIPFCTKIKLYEKDYIPEGLNYQNPRLTFDGIDWWISVGLPIKVEQYVLTEEIIGIDLGLRKLAVYSDGTIIPNISRSKKYKKILKSLKQKQRQVSRKYEQNMQDDKFVKTSNIKKLEKKIQKKRIRLKNIKQDYFHKASTALVRTKPKAIVLEDLNVAGLRKNRYQANSWQESSVSTFKQMIVNKAESHGIEVILADRFFPSSQLCSHCGFRHKNLKDKETYVCPQCGLKIDRDLNASYNLKHYLEFQGKLSLWRAKSNQSSYGKMGFYEEGISQKANIVAYNNKLL